MNNFYEAYNQVYINNNIIYHIHDSQEFQTNFKTVLRSFFGWSRKDNESSLLWNLAAAIFWHGPKNSVDLVRSFAKVFTELLPLWASLAAKDKVAVEKAKAKAAVEKEKDKAAFEKEQGHIYQAHFFTALAAIADVFYFIGLATTSPRRGIINSYEFAGGGVAGVALASLSFLVSLAIYTATIYFTWPALMAAGAAVAVPLAKALPGVVVSSAISAYHFIAPFALTAGAWLSQNLTIIGINMGVSSAIKCMGGAMLCTAVVTSQAIREVVNKEVMNPMSKKIKNAGYHFERLVKSSLQPKEKPSTTDILRVQMEENLMRKADQPVAKNHKKENVCTSYIKKLACPFTFFSHSKKVEPREEQPAVIKTQHLSL